jgi:hypothetical protein
LRFGFSPAVSRVRIFPSRAAAFAVAAHMVEDQTADQPVIWQSC